MCVHAYVSMYVCVRACVCVCVYMCAGRYVCACDEHTTESIVICPSYKTFQSKTDSLQFSTASRMCAKEPYMLQRVAVCGSVAVCYTLLPCVAVRLQSKMSQQMTVCTS